MSKFKRSQFIVVSISMLIMLAVAIVGATYAWFSNSKNLINLNFSTAYIDLEYEIFEGIDYNKDGILDIEQTQSGYIEKYSEPLTGNQAIVISNMFPSNIYTYKIDFNVQSNIITFLSFDWDYPQQNIKNVLSVEVSYKINGNAIITNDKFFLGKDSGNILEAEIPSNTLGTLCSVIIKIKFETLQTLIDEEILSADDLNYYMIYKEGGAQVDIFGFNFTFSS